MKPKQLHQEAMRYSFLAKESFEKGEDLQAQEHYTKAAEIESELARFYFDKPEQEPTRSTIIRSAAFLNLKAGLIGEAQSLIFWGLLNLEAASIKEQLNEALELSITLKNMDAQGKSHNADYLRLLRQRSIHYTIENTLPKFGSAVTFEVIRDFADNYLKSLKAYATVTFKQAALKVKAFSGDLDAAARQFEDLVNPLVTSTAFGSFKFSIANDFLAREGEDLEVVRLKATVLQQYHDDIFTNPLHDAEIASLKEQFKDEEINQIFRPITKIKSANSPYKVAYYHQENFGKVYLSQILNSQKRKLLPLKQISQESIGFLESSIVHTRGPEGGKKSRNVIQKEQLKAYEFEFKTGVVEPKDRPSLILNEEIIVDVMFDSERGFTFSFEDLAIDHTDIDYNAGLQQFNTKFYNKLVSLANADSKNTPPADQVKLFKRLINDANKLKR